jgi:molybdopterin molybdotransferase
MPTLADAVLPLRWTDGGESRVTVLRGVRSGAYVRRTGDDVQPGDVAVRSGTIIGPAQVGLLAAVGRERVLVHPRPRLSVMCVGGELVDISRTPGNGQVYDVNSYALAAAGRDAGAEVNRVGIVDTEPKELREIVEGQVNRAEVVVSRARRWYRRRKCPVGARPTGEMEVTRIAMHPGSVQGFGQLGPEGVPDSAACQPGQCPGGLRGHGAAVIRLSLAAPADAPGSCRPARCPRSPRSRARKGICAAS